MAKRCIGLDIGPHWIKAVQVTRNNGKYRIERYHSAPTRRQSDNPLSILKSLTDKFGFDHRSPAIVNLPPDALFIMNTNEEAEESIEQHNPLMADNALTLQTNQTQDGIKGQLTVVRRNIYHYLLTMIRQSGLKCRGIIPTAQAVQAAALTNHPEYRQQQAILLFEDTRHCFIILSSQGQIVSQRSFPARTASKTSMDDILLEEMDQSWRAVYGNPVPEQTPVYVASHAGDRMEVIQQLSQKRHCPIIELDPFAEVDCPEELRDDFTLCLSEGLALYYFGTSRQDRHNLLKLEQVVRQDQPINFKRQMITAATLAIITILAWTAGTVLERVNLEQYKNTLQTQIETIFKEAVLSVDVIVDPEAQMRQELYELENDEKILGPYLKTNAALDGWNAIIQNRPVGLKLDINELAINQTTIKLHGSAKSEAAVIQWRESLLNRDLFSQIEINPLTNKSLSDRFEFAMIAQIAGDIDKKTKGED